ncbi:MAG: acetyl-CoA carboxylase biotin carboxylase subunit [Candidatus Eisenbacteria bacterium]|nr:acetyl-CoA carboxylase biotin carboxylase subunit [Candidatus Eisenbacteria bacterium]
MKSKFDPANPPRLLVANRGEIALRIIRGAKDEGWKTIAVYSDADRLAPHVAMADEAYPIGPAPSSESYLRIPNLLEAARKGRATHLHPGYGFLSENEALPTACVENGLSFVGPSAAAMRAMGSKTAAREAAQKANVPVVPGSPPLPADPEVAVQWAEKVGYPVLLKAAFGGGGKGMRFCKNADEVRTNVVLARGEAGRSFGNDTIFLERAVVNPRHVEIQMIADRYGNGVYLGERECSIQRRHQKLIEETPSVVVDPATRQRMGEAAVRLALAIGYENAGTCEFLFDQDGNFYFLEMNTRLQVEHPVTELCTGVDLLRAQLRVALGEPLPWKQEEIEPVGAALECRICAEDPFHNFTPVSGRISYARFPQGPGVRLDMAFESGTEVSVYYDSMLGKLITWGRDREEARERMLRALDEFVIEGIPTNLAFHRWALAHPEYIAGRIHTGFIDQYFKGAELLKPNAQEEETLAMLGAIAALREREQPGGAPASLLGIAAGDPSAPQISPWKRAASWRR